MNNDSLYQPAHLGRVNQCLCGIISFPAIHNMTIAVCSLICLSILSAYIANNVNPDETAPLEAV